jgi:hypothetical protein
LHYGWLYFASSADGIFFMYDAILEPTDAILALTEAIFYMYDAILAPPDAFL